MCMLRSLVNKDSLSLFQRSVSHLKMEIQANVSNSSRVLRKKEFNLPIKSLNSKESLAINAFFFLELLQISHQK